MKLDLLCGNNLEVLPTLPDNSVDSVVTDPPYGLSFMGKAWDYDVPKVELWSEVFRVLKPGGHLLSFFGTRTYHRGVVAIEDAGFEIRDQIGWAYGSGFPKSHNLKGEWQGWGTALKPAWEPIVVARKPLIGTVAENVLKHGTGAINIDGCRVGVDTIKHSQDRKSFQKWKELDGRKHKEVSNPPPSFHEGRWPANLIHDGSEEVLQAFPEAPGQMAKSRAAGQPMNNKIYGAMKFGTETMLPRQDNTKSAARFFYCAKASKKDREEGCEALPERQYSHDGREKPIDNAYQRNSNSNSNHHPTVKPTDLMRYLVRLVTPPGGVVLDPFMGSGSTGKAAALEGFGFIGIEIDPEYHKIAGARIRHALDNVPRQGLLY